MDSKNKQMIVDYINSQRGKKVGDEVVKKALLDAGWNEEEISTAFAELDRKGASSTADSPLEPAPPLKERVSAPESGPGAPGNGALSGRWETPELGSVGTQEGNDVNTGAASGVVSAQQIALPNNIKAGASGNHSTESASGGKDEWARNSFGSAKYIFGVAIIAFAVGAASVLAYLALSTGFGGKPNDMSKEEIITEAVVSYMRASSLKNSTLVSFSINDMFGIEGFINGYYEFAEDVFDTKISGDFGGDFRFKDGGMTMELGAEGEFRVINGVLYVNLSKVPEVPYYLADLSHMEDNWVSVDLNEEISEQREGELRGLINKSDEFIKLVEDHGVRVIELAQEEGFLTIESSVVDGDHIFDLDLDLQVLPSFLRALAEMVPDEEYSFILKEMAVEMDEEWEEIESSVDIENGHVVPFRLAVDRKTGDIKEISTNLSIKVKANETLESFFNIKDGLGVNILIVSEFSDMNGSFEVESPDGSIPFDEIISALMDDINDQVDHEFNDTSQHTTQLSQSDRVQGAAIRSDLAQMRAQAQLYTGEDGFSGVCNDGDTGLVGLLDSVDSMSSDWECKDSREQWAAWAELKSEAGYWCVDYTGFSGPANQPPGGVTECPQLEGLTEISYSVGTDSFPVNREWLDILIQGIDSSLIRSALRVGAGWFSW